MLVFAALSLLALVSAQNGTAASQVDVEAVEANFQQAQLVPQLLPTFNPQGTLGVAFSSAAITPGQNLTEGMVASYPSLTVSPSSNATELNTTSMYTIIMADANPVGTDESSMPQTRHWLVNGASLSGSAPYDVNFTGSTAITNYNAPGPASGSGSHRYVLLVYSQPSTFMAPANLSTADTPLGTFDLTSYVTSSGLGDLVAANYFQVEVGTASMTAMSTTAVVTSTLPGYGSSSMTSGGAAGAATGAASGSGSMSGGGASASGSASSAASTGSSKSGAGHKGPLGWGLAVGAVGIVGTVLGAGLGL